MRLTLRTLLAYLDDTLEPMEIKRIGQKVTESDTAQELISRIKQVTRRRRITTPPLTGPNSFEPNMVADYLDSELSAEQVAELEKICLESDVHLAEVASCHQILTLVLGEPASVPPMAKERMYALVHGREAIPFRKAASPGGHAASSASGDHDADEMFLLGLPFYRRNSWLRWALPLAGVVLLAVIGVALWQSVLGVQQPIQTNQVVSANPKDKAAETNPPENKNDTKQEDKKGTSPKDTKIVDDSSKQNETNPQNTKVDDNPSTTNQGTQPADGTRESDPAARKKEPSTERAEAGTYFFGPRSPLGSLMQRQNNEKDNWHRLKANDRVSTTDRLVSLPGYSSEVYLDSGVRLLLRGHVREFSLFPDMNYLQESAIVLHKNRDVAADLTLETGRLYLSNHKNEGPAVVRLRFDKQVWDVTLKEKGTEVVVDLLKRYRGDVDYMKGEEPVATLHLFVLQGKAGLAAEDRHYPDLSAPPGAAYFIWENKRGGLRGPFKQDKIPNFFSRVLPVDPKNQDAEKMDLALKSLSQRMQPPKDPTVVLQEVLQKNEPMQHRLAIYCLGALDEVSGLLDVLGDTDPVHAPDRDTAIFTLRRWLGRDAGNGVKLFDPKTMKSQLLSQQKYKPHEAERIFVLLHDFSEDEIFAVETYELLAGDLISDKVALAELARWHLYRLTRLQGMTLPSVDKFNAAFPRDIREIAFREVRDKIEKNELPVRGPAQGKNGGPGAGGKEPPSGRGGSGVKPKK